MAQTNLNALLTTPGRLCLTPSNMALAFPFGGTDLGLVARIRVRPGKVVVKLREEGLGATAKHGIDCGEAWAIMAAVRSLEQGRASTFFQTAVGAVTGEETIVHNPVANPPGGVIDPVSVMFCPFDEVNQFFVWFPAALAAPEAEQEVERAIRREGLVFVGFDAQPRASDGLAAIHARKGDLVLT